MPFQIIRNDITKVKADAIVNTANPDVAIGGGVDSAIYKAAGKEQLLKERAKIGELLPGEVGVTPAFALNANYIIHVSGPWWEHGRMGEEKVLRSCYDKALTAAFERGCKTIAFPLLATGTYGFPKKVGIQIAVDAFTAFLQEHEMEITLVVFGDESVKISGELVEEVASFIDDDYVESALEEEYGATEYRSDSEERRFHSTSIQADRFLRLDEESRYSILEESVEKQETLEDVLKGIYKESFEKHLQKLINKKGLKNSEVYANANISKQYFSKLLKGQVKPSKGKMLALAVGLRLNLDETIDFLRLGGYALSPISQTDAVVEYFIEHEDYNVIKIDIVLFDYGLDPISNG
ncbi:O-acetyl-ADP-ribose deacetylase (regulator of RNase III), contains Macro domain [Lachnospiraceae bacterium XBB1006]|nr:O-acetyl-ADP-ribose deacetylase (regulator of RNase III), contains Macro domain [Lachnospiraceae bacterium XBB1006]